ncbi:sugar ABC transporter substrate-binding protein [Kitasatospora atroaurantiaca]|uniref:Simple sugar transport system substrate-binding protein/ribose transport system substrate-binding protein n=1 Tax=Kitasatospora atroaurantiaca TaxID=285545 RepID=A0A561F040_9ACTN|nr:sugar ABC transporter substrate-binding protein [Kitasatospora atroaurantiaca]TWE21230.1 simple sugar transport system substrate-binding protein/ribose transport system substrate-binding protein [Kitasatospora atroaurantiaca]
MRLRSSGIAATAGAAVLLAGITGCTSSATGQQEPSGQRKIGIDLPRDDSDFWKAYERYLRADITEQSVRTLPITNSQGGAEQLRANLEGFQRAHAKAVVMAPQATQNIEGLDALLLRGVSVISVDTEPEHGSVYMVVRANNVEYGVKACRFLGKQLKGKGKVAELQGALSSINAYDRSRGFATCMKNEFPGIQVIELATDWEGDIASAKLRTTLAANPDLGGIYLQAGGVFLQPTLALLQQKGLLRPAGQPGHIAIVSNDGIPQELDAIRRGDIDATVSQPADLYAKYALFYAQAGAEGKTFRPGPTDHQSSIISLPNGLEDQLPAPLVTKDNVDDKALWGNTVGR